MTNKIPTVFKSDVELTQGYGHTSYAKSVNFYPDNFHNGYDVIPKKSAWSIENWSIHSLTEGVVVVADRTNDNYKGLNVSIWDPKTDTAVRYYHMSSLNIKKGDKVSMGQVIGVMGATGGKWGAHVHIEYHKTKNGVVVDGYKGRNPQILFDNYRRLMADKNKSEPKSVMIDNSGVIKSLNEQIRRLQDSNKDLTQEINSGIKISDELEVEFDIFKKEKVDEVMELKKEIATIKSENNTLNTSITVVENALTAKEKEKFKFKYQKQLETFAKAGGPTALVLLSLTYINDIAGSQHFINESMYNINVDFLKALWALPAGLLTKYVAFNKKK